jgi:(R,R)-butanediol dehydrogenase/meso-butanediol dehydrogenase/diacetyl reductase
MCAEGQPFWCEKKKSMWGGFGQYTLASESSCVSLPDNLSWNDGALVEPLTSGLHAVRLANVRAGSTALVIGAGPIGLSCVYWLRRFNVASIVVAARSDRRKSVALAMGASSYIATGGKSLGEAVASSEWAPDFVFECAGARGLIDEAMRIVKRRGVVVVAGLCMQPDSFAPSLGILKELRVQFVGAYGVNDFRATVDALASGDLAPRGMISAIIPLEALPEQFEAMRTGSDHCKILVDPWSKGASNDE